MGTGPGFPDIRPRLRVLVATLARVYGRTQPRLAIVRPDPNGELLRERPSWQETHDVYTLYYAVSAAGDGTMAERLLTGFRGRYEGVTIREPLPPEVLAPAIARYIYRPPATPQNPGRTQYMEPR